MISLENIPSRQNIENLTFEISRLVRAFCETYGDIQTKEIISALGELLIDISDEEGIDESNLEYLKQFLASEVGSEFIGNTIH
jgi:hypothetical protein